MAAKGIQFEFVFGFDPAELSDPLIAAHFEPSEMRKSHQSLVMKNVAAWRSALNRGASRILVFEDDAVLDPNFIVNFGQTMEAADQLEPGWLIFLGGHDTKVPDLYFLEKGVFFELPIATTEGYVCDAESLRRRLDWLENNRMHLAFDHQLRLIDKATHVRHFWLTRPLVQQGSVLGIFDSALDGNRNKHSRLYNRLRNRWNKFQRRTLRGVLVRTKAAFGLITK